MKSIPLIVFLFIISIGFAQDGSPDSSFGSNGLQIYEISTTEEYAYSITSMDQGLNGRIAMTALQSSPLLFSNAVIFAFNEGGTIDTTFGNNGLTLIQSDISAPFGKIAVLEDNSILYTLNAGEIIKKLNPDGSFDTSFGTNGSINNATGEASGSHYYVNPDETILTVGVSGFGTSTKQIFVEKYDVNGSLINSFGSNGILEYNIVDFVRYGINPINTKADGAIYINYWLQEDFNEPFKTYVLKLNAQGQIDTTYGINGVVELQSSIEPTDDITFFTDESFVINSKVLEPVVGDRILKFNSLGVPITSFGINGEILNNTIVGLQNNQRLITAVLPQETNVPNDPSLVRYFSNGTIDPSFNFEYQHIPLFNYFTSLTPQNKILIAAVEPSPEGINQNIILGQYNNSPLSINENTISTLKVVPNPSKNIFHILSKESLLESSYSVIDNSGRVLLENTVENENFKIDLSQYTSGIYFLILNNQTLKLLKN